MTGTETPPVRPGNDGPDAAQILSVRHDDAMHSGMPATRTC